MVVFFFFLSERSREVKSESGFENLGEEEREVEKEEDKTEKERVVGREREKRGEERD